MPSPEQRKVAIAVTALDRLRADPYQFYAQAILGLRKLDALDAEPSPASVSYTHLDVYKRQDEALGSLLDPVGADIPPACDPTRRWLHLARIIAQVEGAAAPKGAALLRRAGDVARTIDRLAVEGLSPQDLLSDPVVALVGEQAEHWRQSTLAFLRVQAHWAAALAESGEVDPPVRRNMLFDHAARGWRDHTPEHPVVAVGITPAPPSLARLLRVVADLPKGCLLYTSRCV